MDREARIKLIAEGAARAASDVRGVSTEVGRLGGAASTAQRALTEIGKSAFRMASDAARAMNDVKPISFQVAADNAKKFDDSVSRLAVRANKDIGQLKQQFRDVGKEIGVMPERALQTARALTKLTGSADASDAIRALGQEANETDRSIEEMAELGATLFNKLGVPMNKIGDAIAKVRSSAKEFSTTGGHLAIEDALTRLGPLLARFQGGVNRATATVAVLGQGKSKEVAERTTSSILGAFASADPLLVTKKLREITGNRNYQPYEQNAQGDDVLKGEAIGLLQQRFRRLPYGAVLRFFGNDIAAAQTFLKTPYSKVVTEESRLELEGDYRDDLAKGQQGRAQHRAGGAASRYPTGDQLLRLGTPSRFSNTAAGRRAQTDVERADVELGAGEVIQQQRDKRNAAYAGRRGVQAAVDTLKAYLPSKVERVLDIGEAAAIEAKSRFDASRPSGSPVTVRIDPQSTKSIADALRSAPPVIRTGNSPAAQAVEDSKAKGRSAANF